MSALVDAALACNAPGVLRAFVNVGLLTDDDAEGLEPDRLLEFYRAALRDRWDTQPFTYTPESVAEIVAGTYQPLGPSYDIARRLQMPKDLLFLNRITVGASSILGHLYATADWKSIDCEIRHDGPPATESGRLEAAWRANSGNAVGAAQIARPTRKRCLSSLDGAPPKRSEKLVFMKSSVGGGDES